MLVETFTDSSGLDFYLTPNLRPNNAGVMMIGQNYLQIPPNKYRHEETGGCSGECTSSLMTANIYVERALNHMHKLGIFYMVSNYLIIQLMPFYEDFQNSYCSLQISYIKLVFCAL